MEKDNKIQYKILKSEACGHTIEYKMVKKEHELEKARIDEGLSSREKMKAREARSSKEREPRELSPEQYETGKKIARTKAVTATGEKQRKETLKDVLHTHKQNAPKSPSKEDLEYPMAASEKECLCKDCDCDKKEMNKREKFYIQKIQELRKFGFDQKEFETGLRQKVAATADQQRQQKDTSLENTGIVNRNRAAFGQPMATQGTQSSMGDYVLKDAPQRGERAGTASVNQMTGMNRMLPASASSAQGPSAQAPAPAAGQAPAPAGAAAPQRMQFGKDSGVNFKDAFAQARKSGNQEFDWYNPKTGKTQPYHTHSKEEFQQGKTLAAGRNPEGFQSQTIGADNKYFKGYQAQQKAAPTAQGPVAAPTAQGPAAAPAAKAPNPNANITGVNTNGSISSTESDGRKTLTMPQNSISMARPDQMGMAPALNEPGKVGMKIPGASVKYPEAEGFKSGDTATTQAPTSEQAEGNIKYNKNNKLNANMG